jgi:hypothetical protein
VHECYAHGWANNRNCIYTLCIYTPNCVLSSSMDILQYPEIGRLATSANIIDKMPCELYRVRRSTLLQKFRKKVRGMRVLVMGEGLYIH